MKASTMRLLRFAFACALAAGCFGLAACVNGASSGDSAASSAAPEASSAAADAASSAAEAESSAAPETSSAAPATGGVSSLVNVADLEKTANPDAVAGTETMPALMPANHATYLTQAELPCQTCHGTDESGQPKNAAAAELPKGQYVNEDPSTGQIDPARAQCISCHVVDPQK